MQTTAEAVQIAEILISFLILFVFLFVLRFILSIGRIVRNQEKIIQLLSGIAIKQDVDTTFLK